MVNVKSIIFLLIGGSIILLYVHIVGAGDVIERLSQADPLIFGAAAGCQAGALILWAVRWRILLQPFCSIKLRNSLAGILIGVFFNNITPIAKAGGEPFRAYFLEKKEGTSFEDAFATVAIDRILENFPFVVIIIISLVYFVFLLEISIEMIIILSFALLFNVFLLTLVLYFSFSLKAAKKLMFSFFRIGVKFSSRLKKYENRLERAVEQYHEAIRTVSSQESSLAVSLFISSAFWLLVIMRNYLVVVSLGYQVNFMVIVVVQMVGTLAGIIPILPGGLGSTDGLMIFLYFSFDFPLTLAVTASLLDRFLSFWMMTGVGAGCVLLERKFLER
jgi:uncharacterized protein (TIRG00374 family)